MSGKLLVVVGVVGTAIVALGAREALFRHPNVVGDWRGDIVLPPEGRQEPAANLINGLAATFSLDLRNDHTFHMVAFVVPVDGHWSQSGDTVTLEADKVLGYEKKPSEQLPLSKSWDLREPAHFRVSDDGKKLVLLDQDGPEKLRFIRPVAD